MLELTHQRKSRLLKKWVVTFTGNGMLLIQSTQTHSKQTFEVENIGLVGSSLSFLCTNLKQKFWNTDGVHEGKNVKGTKQLTV